VVIYLSIYGFIYLVFFVIRKIITAILIFSCNASCIKLSSYNFADSSNAHLTVEEKKTLFLISGGKKEENANSTFSRTNTNHQHRDRFVNKCSNRPPETNRSMKISERLTNSKSYERTFTANKECDASSHSDLEDNDANRIKVSQSVGERITKNRESLNTKMTEISSRAHAGKSEGKKFPSKVPVRTWKRLVTKDPPVWRTENNAPNEDVNQGYEKMETTHRNGHHSVMKPENDKNAHVENTHRNGHHSVKPENDKNAHAETTHRNGHHSVMKPENDKNAHAETTHRNGHHSVNPENDKNSIKIAKNYATKDHSDIKGSDHFRSKINVNKSESIYSNSNMKKVRNLKPRV